jgi:hypothetical protein
VVKEKKYSKRRERRNKGENEKKLESADGRPGREEKENNSLIAMSPSYEFLSHSVK